MSTLRIESQKEYGVLGSASLDEIKAGALQRIADACELMARDHGRLIDDRDQYKKRAEWWAERYEKQKRQLAGLRGQITKLKKKLAERT